MRLSFHLSLSIFAVFLALTGISVAQNAASNAKDAFFEKRVAPTLKKNCLECHNPDTSRGSLDLSSRASLLEGGDKGPAVIPGNAKKSLLGQMIGGPKPKMPRERPPLPAEERADLLRWIDDGAHWPKEIVLYAKAQEGDSWWSARPLVRPALPEVKDAKWSDNPIDRFILAMLESKGMKPSSAAERHNFIRRVTYDLHGLPPTPEEIGAFLKDTSPDAFERLIDRLLASPRYGERWGRHWLDIIHYADTHGYDKDKRRLWAWLFRDWVIRAFNQDLPYRRFVRYQLAGDVLFPDDPDGIIATGFVVAGPWDFVGHVELREGTVEKEKTRNLDRDDMVANAMSTFSSMTVHCARCHVYGPGFDLFRFKDDHSPVYDHLDLKFANRPETWRRTVYRFVVRSVPNPLLESLDCADPNISVPVRNTTLTALQALALLNNPFMVAQAENFAERVRKSSPDAAGQVDAAYRFAFGRPPTNEEVQAMTDYIRRHGLANACRLLFNANEFVFVD